MTDVDIGFLTALQARETWETVKILRSSGLLRNLSALKKPDDIGIHHVWIKNSSGEAIPPFACMQVDGTEDVGELTYVKVIKPDKTDGNYLFNHDREIEIDGYGMCLPWGVVRMLGSGAAEVNASYGATVDAWTVQTENGGPFVVYGDDNTRENIYKGRIQSAGGGSGTYVRFQFDSQYYEEDLPELCADRSEQENTTTSARVIGYPCGVTSVFGEDEGGYIDLNDDDGWLLGRDARELAGKTGVAHLFADPEGYECKWVITSINWWKQTINVVDVVDTGTVIRVDFEKQWIGGKCKLPSYEIITDDCEEEDEYYQL